MLIRDRPLEITGGGVRIPQKKIPAKETWQKKILRAVIRKEKNSCWGSDIHSISKVIKSICFVSSFLKRLYLDYLHAISKEEVKYGKRNSCKACASEKQILQTSGLKKILAPKIFHPPSDYLKWSVPKETTGNVLTFCGINVDVTLFASTWPWWQVLN